MNRKMEFFNSLLDKTNKNIEVIANQLNEIQQNHIAMTAIAPVVIGQPDILAIDNPSAKHSIPWKDLHELQEVLQTSGSQSPPKYFLAKPGKGHKQLLNSKVQSKAGIMVNIGLPYAKSHDKVVKSKEVVNVRNQMMPNKFNRKDTDDSLFQPISSKPKPRQMLNSHETVLQNNICVSPRVLPSAQ